MAHSKMKCPIRERKKIHPCNVYRTKAVKRMTEFEKSMCKYVCCPFKTLSEVLELSDSQCVYCTKVFNKLDIDEVWPSTIIGRPGRINSLNQVNACPTCNKSKSNKIEIDFIEWVKTGGVKKANSKKIPVYNRDKIISWYKLCNSALYTRNVYIVELLKNEYNKSIEICEQRNSNLKSKPHRNNKNVLKDSGDKFQFNRKLILLLECESNNIVKRLAKYLEIGETNIYLWKRYEKTSRAVPPRHHEKIIQFFKS
jgi:hypothetical protein